MGSPQYIKLNGNLYDPASGRLLRGKQDSPDSSQSKSLASTGQKAIDSVLGRSDRTKLPAKKISAPLPKKIASPPKRTQRKVAPSAARPAQHSKTLMRQSVKKPIPPIRAIPNNKTQIKHHASLVAKFSDQTKNLSAKGMDSALKASQVSKSTLVTKFGAGQPKATMSSGADVIAAPVSVHDKKLEQLAVQEKEIKNEADIDNYTLAALDKADSFKELSGRKRPFYVRLASKLSLSPRAFILSLSALIIVLVAAGAVFVYYQNIAFYLATKKASVTTHLPSYEVPGFSINSIHANTSSSSSPAVVIDYHSNSDSRNYNISEQSSSWDNQSLLSAVVTPAAGSNYTTETVNGLTIYGYKTTDVWVNAGVYYQINNNAGLTTDQILQIVNGA